MNDTSSVLYIGSRRYSSWSLRGWLAVRLAGLAVEERVIPLAGGHTPAVKAASPSGMVPFLEHEGARVWDSLAIVEYCAEIAPQLWPAARIARAHARAITAEMHSGFRELRLAMPMNCTRRLDPAEPAAAVRADLDRIEAIWAETRARFGAGGPFLFGAAMTAADAMYAPVVSRLLTYRPEVSAATAAYIAAVRAHELVDAWYRAAAAEPEAWKIARFEA
ncbi:MULTISPECIES: glutathione S-transferase family protein [unclassified Acidiphilium]|jgi:glutathione S-transferase|uniref:glutathione S-transferase family protein n=1 Tax=unclassified Acidiphilium TaxID=2617493 RepID=UPI000BC3E441|nr:MULTISPECIES: glutathione S-transferase family protein [unclassified Acidiphilium]OYV57302.1 MAG: glutathione S-transferase [Acidiphilium sp. 20-67-58]HQT60519.1 glutathione S-transferase family protein [Acidiphilium sp.]